ncbi:MAG: arginine--tRNA ligase, partial [Candidatus Helarchaeota archaeon]
MEKPWTLLNEQIIKELERILTIFEVEKFSHSKWETLIEEPPDRKLGDFATTICFHLSKILQKAPRIIAEMISKELLLDNLEYFSKVEVAGPGYINFYIDWKKFNGLVLSQ